MQTINHDRHIFRDDQLAKAAQVARWRDAQMAAATTSAKNQAPTGTGQGTGTAANAPAPPNALRYLRTQPIPTLIGSVPAAVAGGTAQANVAWNPSDVPEVPAWAAAIDLEITLPLSVTVPANSTVQVSPYAPYSCAVMQMILAGSPEWPSNTSLVPWWLDNIQRTIKSDALSHGPDYELFQNIPKWWYGGPTPTNFNGVYPGAAIANATGSPVVHTWTWQFTVRIQLQRKPSKMWGMIPLGDPNNRPQVKMQLTGIVGPNPENNVIQDPSSSGATGQVGSGGAVINMVFRAKSLDILPASVGSLPAPVVGMGLNVTYDNSLQIQNAGAILYQKQNTAQVYTEIWHLLVNSEAPVNPDYIGLWLTNNRQSARYEYDASIGNIQDYYDSLKRQYGRYLPTGVIAFDLENGGFPDIPRETPYNGLMSPDAAYAAAAGVQATPNMATAFRVPAGTSMSGAYAATYAMGLVTTPY